MRKFSLERLEKLFKLYPDAFWRHDVDFSVDAALKMAHFEAERGVKATFYFFMQAKQCPFYDPYEAFLAECEIYDLGHQIGQHINERVIDPFDDKWPIRGKISFHVPTEKVLWKKFETFTNAYEPQWKHFYYADSGGEFRHGDPEDHQHCDGGAFGPDKLQINLHPEWWFEKGWYHDVPDDVYEKFFYCGKPTFVDSRRGRPVRNGERDIWAFDPRPWTPVVALWVSPEQYDFVMNRGYAEIDGQRCVPLHEACDPELGFLRLRFTDGPYRIPEGGTEQPDVWRMKS